MNCFQLGSVDSISINPLFSFKKISMSSIVLIFLLGENGASVETPAVNDCYAVYRRLVVLIIEAQQPIHIFMVFDRFD